MRMKIKQGDIGDEEEMAQWWIHAQTRKPSTHQGKTSIDVPALLMRLLRTQHLADKNRVVVGT